MDTIRFYMRYTYTFFTVSSFNYKICDGRPLPTPDGPPLSSSPLFSHMAMRQRLQRNLSLARLFLCHGP